MTSPDPKPRISDIFGSKTFDYDIMREKLPADAYAKLRATIAKGQKLDQTLAEVVAHAMKVWAMAQGATHYTHWFQPLTRGTAEKHDAFLSHQSFGNSNKPIERFSASSLVQAEPDASSFPSGGMRSTFEARGYTAWDPTSPAFIMGNTLTIPSVFLSYNGDALDKKTPLLRSITELDKAVRALLETLGSPSEAVYPTIGPEQEFFLIPKRFYDRRPDLRLVGTTVMGKPSPKGQKMEDHYFGSIPEGAMKFFLELEEEAFKLGIPLKTRHNEVAPSQFELAPLFEHANVGNDHNALLMPLMCKIAKHHGLECLLYEKPFKDLNGSGKHNNWSLMSHEGRNLLNPGKTQEENLEFLLFLTTIIHAIHRRNGLIRSVVATPGNDYRLGGNEAPPGIISVFVGSALEEILEKIVQGGNLPLEETISTLDLGILQLPKVQRHNTDRNRTSPFAFTGDKFEFRAVGSSQSLGFPNAFLNIVVAEAVDLSNELLKKKLSGGKPRDVAILEVVRDLYITSKPIIFNGNNYSEEWVEEAKKRGLPVVPNGYEALKALLLEDNKEVLRRILSDREIVARYNVAMAKTIHNALVMGETMLDMTLSGVRPTVVRFMAEVSQAQAVVRQLGIDDPLAGQLARLYGELNNKAQLLQESLAEASVIADVDKQGSYITYSVKPAMNDLREVVDSLEELVPFEHWPFPSYVDLLHSEG